jgi:NADPH2:quinone reductase
MKHAPHAPPRADGVGSWQPLRNRQVTFRAYGGPEQVVMVEQADVAPPGPGEARVRVEASSLVFTDTLIRRDLYPMRRTQPGEVLGYDLVGHVESLGSATDGPRPGTRVAALTQVGGGQDWVSLPVPALVPVPGDLDPIRIEPLILSYMTAWQSLTRLAKVNAGDRVLVVAASGAVGFAALDIARARVCGRWEWRRRSGEHWWRARGRSLFPTTCRGPVRGWTLWHSGTAVSQRSSMAPEASRSAPTSGGWRPRGGM